MSSSAFAPGNISCIFVIRKSSNPRKSGSLGVGFTVNKGVLVSVRKNKKNIVYFNNKKIKFPTVNSVIKELSKERFEIKIKSELPLGCGFGISGASALATSFAINKLLKLKKSNKELALLAHIAEVKNLTGLGDVLNQYYGGFLIRYKSSYHFKVKKLNMTNKPIYYKVFNKISTKKIMSNKKIKSRINQAGLKALRKLKSLKQKNLKNIISTSREFSINSGLLKNKIIMNLIKKIENNGGNASMIMLGNAVFSDKYFKGSKKLIIKDKGAHVV